MKVSKNEVVWSLFCQCGKAPGTLKKWERGFWLQTQGYKTKTLRNVIKEESRRRTRTQIHQKPWRMSRAQPWAPPLICKTRNMRTKQKQLWHSSGKPEAAMLVEGKAEVWPALPTGVTSEWPLLIANQTAAGDFGSFTTQFNLCGKFPEMTAKAVCGLSSPSFLFRSVYWPVMWGQASTLPISGPPATLLPTLCLSGVLLPSLHFGYLSSSVKRVAWTRLS